MLKMTAQDKKQVMRDFNDLLELRDVLKTRVPMAADKLEGIATRLALRMSLLLVECNT